MKNSIIVILAALACFSCADESLHITDPRVSIYFRKFDHEASKRGVSLDWKGLDVVFIDRSGGLTRFDPNNNTVYFDTTDWCYINMREELVSHELGHALLNRQHDFEKLPNNMYKSVMGNFSNRMYSGWSADSVRFRQEYYYDELFNQNTAAPYWGTWPVSPFVKK